MYTLDEIPTTEVRGALGGDGVIGLKSGRHTVSLFPGALLALQEIAAGKYPGMRAAAASSADTPFAVQCARASLAGLEIQPGVTFLDVLRKGFDNSDDSHIQIGRSPPLSSNKTSHFALIQKATGIAYDKMLFFDDCGWSDNCAVVERGCPGVTTMQTPNGMTAAEWRAGLQKYAGSHR